MNAKIYPNKFFKGYPHLHDTEFFNATMIRMIDWGGGSLQDLQEAAHKIKDMQTWVKTLTELGDKAMLEKRTGNAIAYYRMVEAFTSWSDPQKAVLYDKTRDLFYDFYADYFGENGEIKRERVAYENASLPVWKAIPKIEKPKGILVFHGGYDSYLEEFLQIVLYFVRNGYVVYAFEGPGQSEVIRKSGLPFTPDWQKPVSAILNHYQLDNVTIIGGSLGGSLAPRAAAVEKRIKRVISWSGMPDFLDSLLSTRSNTLQKLTRWMLKLHFAPVINAAMKSQTKSDPMAKWGFEQGINSFGLKSAYQFMRAASKIRVTDVGGKISQDVLIISGDRDHFAPVGFYRIMIDAMPNARTMTYRLFTEKELSGAHCIIGNTQALLDCMLSWLGQLEDFAIVGEYHSINNN